MSYVRAIYEFTTTEPGEINLCPGDVVLLLYDVDENWSCGNLNGQEGTFPKAFVEPVLLPAPQAGQTIFMATRDFVGEMSGDLGFRKGDIVVGLKTIDKNWYHGEREGKCGMFPSTHVTKLDLTPARSFQPPSSQKYPPQQTVKSSPSSNYAPQQTQQADQQAIKQETSSVIARGVANMDITAQIDDELSFSKGDVVNVTQVIDSDFAMGECNGQTGMFSLAFVEIYEGEIKAADVQSPREKRRSKFRWWEEEGSSESSTAVSNISSNSSFNSQSSTQYSQSNAMNSDVSAPLDYGITSQHNNVSNTQSQMTNDSYGHSSGTADTVHQSMPQYGSYDSAYSSLQVPSTDPTPLPYGAPSTPYTSTPSTHDSYGYTSVNTASSSTNQHDNSSFKKTHKRTGSYTQENTRSHDFSVVAYATTLFPFIAENANELTFVDNEIVTLIQHIDEQWIEGEIDGKRGIFPTSYVEIIVDCPWSESAPQITEETSLNDESSLAENFDQSRDEDESRVSQNEVTGDEPLEVTESEKPKVSQETIETKRDAQNDMNVNVIPPSPDVVNVIPPSPDVIQTQSKDEPMLPAQSESESPALTDSLKNDKSQDSPTAFPFIPCFGLVLYDYKPENTDDITFSEGDTVCILQQVDEDWFAVENEDGKTGFCPINYVEVITPEPDAISSDGTSGISTNDSTTKDSRALAFQSKDSAQITENKDDSVIKASEGTVMEKKGTDLANKPAIVPKPAIKPKPSLKPKPGLKPKPVSQKGTILRAKSEDANRLNVSDNKVAFNRANSADVYQNKTNEMPTESSPNHDSIKQSKQSDIPTRNNNNKPVEPASAGPTVIKHIPANKTPPKRPTHAPRVPVFTGSVKKDDNLDDIIKNQMQVAKSEADIRGRSSSMNSFQGDPKTPPPIPDRKNVPSPQDRKPLNRSRSLSTETPPIPQRKGATRKRVAFSTFYAGNEFTTTTQEVTRKPTLLEQARTLEQQSPAGSGTTPDVASKTGSRLNSHRTPVPNRPAPPRPGAMKPANGNLMEFSPDKENVPTGLESECDEIVADLDKRIAEREADLNKYVVEKEQLEERLMAPKVDTSAEAISEGTAEGDVGLTEEERESIREQIGFTEANIKGLTEELNTLKESLYQFRPDRMQADLELQRKAELQKLQIEEQRRKEEEAKKHHEELVAKHRETRMRVIQEVLQTEKDYLHSISLCQDVFSDKVNRPEVASLVDMELLFGNMQQVIAISQRLLSALEEATQGKDFEEQVIGTAFVNLKSDMTKVYAPYCRNHDDVITLLEKYEESPEIQDYFNKRLDVMRQSATVFDLGSVLIKPVQRILKYPLLLNELIKNTEEDHVDKTHLHSAMTVMTQVAAAINEYKRRKDLVRKYKAVKEEGLGEKFSKLSMHSTKKKFARFSQKMVGPLTVDENFNHEERKYKGLEAAIRMLVRDLSAYMDQVQEACYCIESLANDIVDYYDDQAQQPIIQQYCQCTNQIATKLFYKYKQQVELQVLHPLNRLLILFSAPNKVIKKRHDKLLDYDNSVSKGVSRT